MCFAVDNETSKLLLVFTLEANIQLHVVDHDSSPEKGSDNSDQEFWRSPVSDTKTLDIRPCLMFKEVFKENPITFDLEAVARGKNDLNLT